MKKLITFGVILLFLGSSIPILAQSDKSNLVSLSDRHILYVGGSGPGNFSTIQEAMANASNGDTIIVYPGIYGTLTITKSLHIIGLDKFSTVLNGTGLNAHNAVAINTSDVSLSGFTIQNGGNPDTSAWGSGIDIQHRYNIIVSDCFLKHNYIGIFLNIVGNVLLENLTFMSKGGAISFWDGEYCTISHCVFNNSGISDNGFPGSEFGCSLMIRNNVFTNKSGINLGYLCVASHGNTTIESNVFQGDTCAINIDRAEGVNIWKNNFMENVQNVAIYQEYLIGTNPAVIKQHWLNNYWDDWNHNRAYAIPGVVRLYIPFLVFYHFQFIWIELPIFRVHYKEYDPAPAQQPYEIP